MKYIAIIDTDDFKDFEFFEDGNGKYLVAKDAGAENDEWIALHFTEYGQEPKTGHREYNDIYDHYLCGNCKTIVMDYDNFCPNCGAKMVKPDEGYANDWIGYSR